MKKSTLLWGAAAAGVGGFLYFLYKKGKEASNLFESVGPEEIPPSQTLPFGPGGSGITAYNPMQDPPIGNANIGPTVTPGIPSAVYDANTTGGYSGSSTTTVTDPGTGGATTQTFDPWETYKGAVQQSMGEGGWLRVMTLAENRYDISSEDFTNFNVTMARSIRKALDVDKAQGASVLFKLYVCTNDWSPIAVLFKGDQNVGIYVRSTPLTSDQITQVKNKMAGTNTGAGTIVNTAMPTLASGSKLKLADANVINGLQSYAMSDPALPKYVKDFLGTAYEIRLPPGGGWALELKVWTSPASSKLMNVYFRAYHKEKGIYQVFNGRVAIPATVASVEIPAITGKNIALKNTPISSNANKYVFGAPSTPRWIVAQWSALYDGTVRGKGWTIDQDYYVLEGKPKSAIYLTMRHKESGKTQTYSLTFDKPTDLSSQSPSSSATQAQSFASQSAEQAATPGGASARALTTAASTPGGAKPRDAATNQANQQSSVAAQTAAVGAAVQSAIQAQSAQTKLAQKQLEAAQAAIQAQAKANKDSTLKAAQTAVIAQMQNSLFTTYANKLAALQPGDQTTTRSWISFIQQTIPMRVTEQNSRITLLGSYMRAVGPSRMKNIEAVIQAWFATLDGRSASLAKGIYAKAKVAANQPTTTAPSQPTTTTPSRTVKVSAATTAAANAARVSAVVKPVVTIPKAPSYNPGGGVIRGVEWW